MTVEQQYLYWLQDGVDPSHSFGLLIEKLYSIAYEWSVPIDENLEWLGIDLRERFMKECDIYDMSGMAIVLVHPCSIIEVLCGLAWDIELDILGRPDRGHNTPLRFFDLLEFLKLDLQFDDNFSSEFVEKTIKERLTGQFFEKSYIFFFQNFIYERYFLSKKR